jgi:hypothetical protein|tara:strand:+ start:72 stop:896 length:825 start_codon:yes stop_codon:yes gene_type:complete
MPAAIFAGVTAAASIVGGIMGSNQASKNNKQAKKNHEEQKKAAKKIAKKTNEHNDKVFAADKENYYSNREYDWKTTVKNWKYNQSIQDYNYLQTVKQYQGSVENTLTQLTYNSMAAMEARESEQASLVDILNEDAFQRESLLVEQLKNEGQVALLQAGNSRSKAIQSALAQTGRDSAVMDASIQSAQLQSQRNMRDIAMGKFIDDQNVMASMMIRPDRLPALPEPIQTPERIFVEPMEATEAYIPAPLTQSTFAPIAQGIASAAGAFANPALFT